MSEASGHNYGAGYGKPPVATRFSKGRSGNPKGRPRGLRNIATILEEVTRETVRVTENGKVRTMTKLEAITRQLTTKALSGDLKAIKDVLALRQVCEAVTDQTSPGGPDMEKSQAIMRSLVERIRAIQGADNGSMAPAVMQNGEDTQWPVTS